MICKVLKAENINAFLCVCHDGVECASNLIELYVQLIFVLFFPVLEFGSGLSLFS